MSSMRIATIASHNHGGQARLVNHFAVGNLTLCRVQLAGATVKAPDPDEVPVDCQSCVQRVHP